jgi:fatty acid amide hydrolase
MDLAAMLLWQASAARLASMLACGEVSAQEVLRAHLDRIAALDGRLHAFTEVFRDQAMADASASDGRRRCNEARGPLDGVPVSVKECFDVAGQTTTLGIPAWRGHIAERNASLVTLLREAGAVLLGRTNLSQTMLFAEARNPLFGQTANPWSLGHSCGGSSGGEAAAIAAGMSPLGVGTDIGGSIRTPAHFCGICGFKATLDRLPMYGYRGVLAGQEVVRSAAGPLARRVEDLELFFRAVNLERASELDPRVPPLAWSEPAPALPGGLRVGYYIDDGLLSASPALGRAVHRAADALRARGYDLVAFEPPAVCSTIAAYLGALSADGGEHVLLALRGGEVDPALVSLRLLAFMPRRARLVAARAARTVGQKSLALMLEAMGKKTVGELWRLTERLRTYRASLLSAMDAQQIELLLCPPYATCALPHGASKGFTLGSSYSILFNAAQFPAGTVPVTRVRLDEARRPNGSHSSGIAGAWSSLREDSLARRAAAIDDGSAGLPVGVQMVGRPWRDHLVLSAMKAIEAEVSSDDGFPQTPVEPPNAQPQKAPADALDQKLPSRPSPLAFNAPTGSVRI